MKRVTVANLGLSIVATAVGCFPDRGPLPLEGASTETTVIGRPNGTIVPLPAPTLTPAPTSTPVAVPSWGRGLVACAGEQPLMADGGAIRTLAYSPDG